MASLRPYSKNDSGDLINDIPTTDDDRFSDEHYFTSELTSELTPLNYIRKTYAGSMNAGLIASIEDLKAAKNQLEGRDELKESAKLIKSNNNLDHGIDIEEG